MLIADVCELDWRVLFNEVHVYGVVVDHFGIGDEEVVQNGAASQYVCAELND